MRKTLSKMHKHDMVKIETIVLEIAGVGAFKATSLLTPHRWLSQIPWIR